MPSSVGTRAASVIKDVQNARPAGGSSLSLICCNATGALSQAVLKAASVTQIHATCKPMHHMDLHHIFTIYTAYALGCRALTGAWQACMQAGEGHNKQSCCQRLLMLLPPLCLLATSKHQGWGTHVLQGRRG